MKKIILFVIIAIGLVVWVFHATYQAGYTRGKDDLDIKVASQTELQVFYMKTRSEITNSQKSIQKIMDDHGEQVAIEIIQGIVFKNFCEIPGVIDTVVSQKVTIK